MNAAQLAAQLQLAPHPEGGYYRETYRSESCTAITFLLGPGDVSRFHRIDRDELWFWHAGELTVHVLDPRRDMALSLSAPQCLVKAGEIFGATVAGDGIGLVSCVVSPPFRFEGFELLDASTLLTQFPAEAALIERLT